VHTAVLTEVQKFREFRACLGLTWIKENISSDENEISSEFTVLSSIDFLIPELIKTKLLIYYCKNSVILII
jgi:hypothetical protein